jgi:hypothetical protein
MFIGSDKARSGGDPAAQRVGRPEEIAQTIMFLASDKASFITGASYLKDEEVLSPWLAYCEPKALMDQLENLAVSTSAA